MASEEFEQSALLEKLDLGFTAFLLISGALTFPPALFVYYRILTLRTFKHQFLMKLFVFNGAMNILFYLMNLATTQFTNWPSTYKFYTWLNATFIPPVLRFLQARNTFPMTKIKDQFQDYASCAQWQSQFCISLNRLLSMKHDYLLKQHGHSIFLFSLYSSFLFSLAICIPIVFSGFRYFEIEVGDNVFAYVPGGVEGSAAYYLPSQIHQLGFAIVTLIINLLTCVVLMAIRKEFQTQSRSRPEQGLLLSSFCSTFAHILNDAVLLVVFSNAQLVGLSYFITLFIAIATTLPFWTMIGFAHTMRRAVLSGTAFESVTSTGGWATQSQSSQSRPQTRGESAADLSSKMDLPDPAAVCKIGQPSYTENYANFGPWGDFIAGFIALFSNHINYDVMNEIGDFLFGQALFSNAAFDLLTSQPTFLIFFWLGVVISAVSIVGAVLLLIPNTRHWSTEKISSKTMNLTGVILAVASFLVIGVALGLYFIPPLVANDGSQGFQMTEVNKNLDKFMSTKFDNQCFMVNTVEPVVNMTTTLTDTAIYNFDTKTGLQAASEIDYHELGDQLIGNSSLVDEIIEDLRNVAAMYEIVDDAQDEVHFAIQDYEHIQTLLKPDGLPSRLSKYGDEIKALKETADRVIRTNGDIAATYASDNIYNVYSDVARSVGDAEKALESTEAMIAKAASSIDKGMIQMQETYDSPFGIIISIFVLVFIIIVLVASIVSIVSGAIFMASKSSSPSSHATWTGLYILAFIVLVLTSFVFGPTLFVMVMGYSVQTSCQPFFYDSNLKGLQTMVQRLPQFNIAYMNNPFAPINTSFVDVMLTCKGEYDKRKDGSDGDQHTTFFSAVVGGNKNAVDEGRMMNAMNYTAVFNQYVFNVNESYIPAIREDDYDYIADSIEAIATTPDLTLASKVPAAADAIKDILDKAAQFESDMKPILDECQLALDDTEDLLDEDKIKNTIFDDMKKLLHDIDSSMSAAAEKLYNFLYTDGESCGNLYRSWADAGDLGCKETNIIWNGQGMWPAAGLAALFFLPLALSLVCIANAHRHGKEELIVHPVPHEPKPQPAPAPVVHTQQPTPHSAQPPPLVPTRTVSRLPYQSTHYMPAEAYLNPQPANPQFDPLAYTTPATGAVAYRRVAGSSTTGQYPAQF